MTPEGLMERLGNLKRSWTESGQGHVFRFADKLDPEELRQLVEQAESIDLDLVRKAYENAVVNRTSEKKELTPFPEVVKPSQDPLQAQQWRSTGLKEIASGHVACVLLAGGQGTRLSATDPKGMYDTLLPSGSTLFRIQAERIRRVKELAAKQESKDPSEVSLRWYILTSKATHKATLAYFESQKYFGLDKDSIYFFSQSNLPCLTSEGKIILESASVIAEAPNGNGGIYAALQSSGALRDMESHNVRTVFCYGVDNVLVRLADPVFVGCFVNGGYDCGAKVVPKAYPTESVGVLCLTDGKPMVVEYSEIGETLARKCNDDGSLMYNQGNICIHIYSLEFLKKIGKTTPDLPYHVAEKKIPAANEQGVKEMPSGINGWKLEAFIFDAFPFCSKMLAFEVVRCEEFAPLKNATGNDSPDSCRTLLARLNKSYIEAAGGIVEGLEGIDLSDPKTIVTPSQLIEVSPLLSYAGEGLEEYVKGKRFQVPIHLSREGTSSSSSTPTR